VVEVRIVPTYQLSRTELRTLRALLEESYEDGFTDDDWDHTVGGLHVFVVHNDIVSHAAVVERVLVATDRAFRTGYVEGVATATHHRGRGHASRVMREVGKLIRNDYELGALSTGLPDFYARLGWEPWRGPTYTSSPSGPRRTADDDDAVMILRTEATRHLDSTTPLMCDWRSGDVW
jgi:aminoglycoside 2'-N-acetyltransferase I